MVVKPVFGKHQLLLGEKYKIRLVEKEIEFTREKEGWNIQTFDAKLKLQEKDNIKSTINEYFQTGKSNSLVIQPALPEKPIIFKGSLINVAPNQKLTFFIKIPLNIQIFFSRPQPENLIKEFSWQRLSDSWFGEPDSGEPAFSAGNEYFLKIEDIDPQPYEAICPVIIFNNSSTVLEVERLIIRIENLSLFSNEGRIVTSVVHIEYKGKDSLSSAEYHYSKIYNGEKQVLLAKPRNTSAKNLLKINFHFIRNIYKSE